MHLSVRTSAASAANGPLLISLLAAIVCLLLLAGCAPSTPAASSTEEAESTEVVETPNETEAPDDAAPTDAPATEEAETAFPVTIEHKYGSTAIEAYPEHIVTVGLLEQDTLLALGIVPVGTTEWFGEYPGSIWPWAQDELGDAAPPESLGTSAEVDYEKIAALNPDLILALYSGLTQDQYDLLTEIAPTVAQPAEYVDYGIPWQELTRKVGLAVGKGAEADALVTDVEAEFEQVRADHPEFEGASAVVATPYEGVWVYGPEDVRGRLLTAMGFTLPENLAEITGAEFGGNLSLERLDLLDVDAIIWLDATDDEGILGEALYSGLAVNTEAREIFVDSFNDPLGGATSFVTVLSLPYLLEGLVPKLSAAVDGDPGTVVP
jgi:iron complex transport system substrate-binding protein